jgi:hypothetical protein
LIWRYVWPFRPAPLKPLPFCTSHNSELYCLFRFLSQSSRRI